MAILQNILLLSSCLLLIALTVRTGRHMKVVGMPALFLLIVAYLVWVVGDLIEANSVDYQWMLWGRNIQQIGVFLAPLFSLYFSVDYTANSGLKKLAHVFTAVQIVAVLLIFTDQSHHIMRQSVSLVPDAVFGRALVVQSTQIGSALIAVNFCLLLMAVVNLIIFARKVTAKLKRPLWIIIISMGATFFFTLMQAAVLEDLGIIVPIPVWNLPCVVLFSYAVLRNGFTGVAPTAYNKVFEVIEQGIIIIDEYGDVIEFNRRASELMADMDTTLALAVGTAITPYLLQGQAATEKFTAGGIPGELRNRRRSRYLSVACHALEAHKGKLLGYVIVLTDITLLKIRAEIDSLTGSFNREGLTSAFTDLQKDEAHFPYLSALIIDMDDFKGINDTYGHFEGDMILRDFVGVAKDMLPAKHFLGRLGGDEFVAILPVERQAAAAMADALRVRIAERSVQHENHTIQYTISVGIASCANGECTLSELLHKADIALYEAKHQGKNTISVEAADN